MSGDMCVPCGEGVINLRVGAIIRKDGKLLMAGNHIRPEYLYTVGGRIRFGETAEQAVVREVFEETGVHLEVDRLGFVHETYFINDMPVHFGKPVYEVSFYFYMKVPADFAPVSDCFTDGGHTQFLTWIRPDDPVDYFPEFFRTELLHPKEGVLHFVTDER